MIEGCCEKIGYDQYLKHCLACDFRSKFFGVIFRDGLLRVSEWVLAEVYLLA